MSVNGELSDDDEFELTLDVDNLKDAVDELLQELNFGYHCAQELALLSSKTTSLESQSCGITKKLESVSTGLEELKAEQERLIKEQETDVSEVKHIPDDDDEVLVLPASANITSAFPKAHAQISSSSVVNKQNLTEQQPDKDKTSPQNDVIPIGTMRVQPPPKFNLQRGPVKKKVLEVSAKIYARKANDMWFKATVSEIRDNPKLFKVKYDGKGVKWLDGKQIAYSENPECVLPVGTRIIAAYKEDDNQFTTGEKRNGLQYQMYAGIIAEPPNPRNNYMYLVFFDDGYAQYSNLNEIHMVYLTSTNVWEDMYADSRDFIKEYLQQYPERPMVRLQQGQNIKVEWNAQWWTAKVLEVNASLVNMFFEADKRTEWIYRGSTRLEPLYRELMNAEVKKQQAGLKTARRHITMPKHKQHTPFVEYTRGVEPKKKMLARKSTGGGPKPKSLNYEPEFPRPAYGDQHYDGSEGQRFTEKRTFSSINSVQYVRHQCGTNCIQGVNEDIENLRGKCPFLYPILCGWERQIAKKQPGPKQLVFYKGPCGRRLRSMMEVMYYLNITNSNLTIDCFSLDPGLDPFGYFMPQKSFCEIKDLSYGKESIPVPCVNGVDREYPDYIEYSKDRIPTKGVDLILSPDFLAGCDCEDECQNRNTCACHQLTITASKANPAGQPNYNAGYLFRRLREPAITGVYECNARCKCSYKCYNRVAQNGLTHRLQVFKTDRKGWGLRCLNDIPAGAFICIYAGQLLTEQSANEDGNRFGDEYMAELDHIEVVEQMKEGYESDVVDPEDDDDEDQKEEETSEESGCAEGTDSSYSGTGKKNMPENELSRSEKSLEGSKQKSTAEWITNLPSSQNNASNTDLPELISEQNKAEDSNSSVPHDDDSDSRVSSDKQQSAALRRSSRLSKLPDPKSKEALSGSPLKNNMSATESSREMGRSTKENIKYKPLRSYYNEEYCFVMDAKSSGNLGRYLNHSCEPNVFVQNVFVDSQDLRFPWVAFFAERLIRAGSELTWDYNYEIGSVPGKVLYCYCGSDDCRGRLL